MTDHDPMRGFAPFIGKACSIYVDDSGSRNDEGEPAAGRFLGILTMVTEMGIFYDVLGKEDMESYDIAFEPWANVRGIYRRI